MLAGWLAGWLAYMMEDGRELSNKYARCSILTTRATGSYKYGLTDLEAEHYARI